MNCEDPLQILCLYSQADINNKPGFDRLSSFISVECQSVNGMRSLKRFESFKCLICEAGLQQSLVALSISCAKEIRGAN